MKNLATPNPVKGFSETTDFGQGGRSYTETWDSYIATGFIFEKPWTEVLQPFIDMEKDLPTIPASMENLITLLSKARTEIYMQKVCNPVFATIQAHGSKFKYVDGSKYAHVFFP